MSEKHTGDELMALIRKHCYEFDMNPGGAEIWHRKLGRLQIPYMDDHEDYEKIVVWLREGGIEP